MSTIYITEPPTKGKVLLKTTLGDVDIELWAKEAPRAVRNFVQLCLEGQYDNTIFHRVIKNFIAQGGDPTGTGEGGESIYGEPFPDEFHQRIRFNRRGLVAMASSGPCTNQSQFFITLDKTEELQRKHTITSVEVLWNPFEDIIPRDIKPKKDIEQEAAEKAKPEKKNLSLLSFGDEDELEESAPTGMKSSHHFPSKMLEESMQKRKAMGLEGDVDAYPIPSSSASKASSSSKEQPTKPKAKRQRKKYNEETGEEDVVQEEEEEEAEEEGTENMDFGARMRAKLLAKKKKYEPEAPKKPAREAKGDDDSDDDNDDSDDEAPTGSDGKPKKEVDEIYRRKESKLFFKKQSANFAQKRNTGKLSEKSLAVQLDKFKKNLKTEPQGEDDDWKNHSLVFEKEVNRVDPFAKKVDDGYAVYDPLKSHKERQKHSNVNLHQRRLTAVKNAEKW